MCTQRQSRSGRPKHHSKNHVTTISINVGNLGTHMHVILCALFSCDKHKLYEWGSKKSETASNQIRKL